MLRYNHDGSAKAHIAVDEFGNFRFRRQINVPQELIDECRREFEDSKTRPAGDGFGRGRLFALPPDLFYDWLSEGFDPGEVSPMEVAAKLRAEGLDYLICNAKL